MKRGCALFCLVEDVGWVVECVGTFGEEVVVVVCYGFAVAAEVEHGFLDVWSCVIGDGYCLGF